MTKSIVFHFKKPEDSSGFLLWQVNMHWQRKIKKELDILDITHTQFVLMAALAWLSKTQRNVTQIEIAKHSQVDRMMASKVLQKLEAKGYLSRVESEVDVRAKYIHLTKTGQVIIQKALKIVEAVDNDFFHVLAKKQNDFNTGMQVLLSKNEH
jgi:DNA-binding MarR family transcriptional regulator